MEILSIPKSHPSLAKLKPGEEKDVLVTIKMPEMDDSEGDDVDCEVLKIDGVPMDMQDDESAEGEAQPEGDTFSSMLPKPKKQMESVEL